MKFTFTGLLTFILLFTITFLFGQEPQIINIENRTSLTLNGVWKYVVDPYQTGYYDYRRDARDQMTNPSNSESLFLGYKPKDQTERVEYDFDKSDNILVPRDWNSQKEKLFYYEGSVWYYKNFDYPAPAANTRQYLYFGAANYEADVYLNGKKLGKHIGGFTPFDYEITSLLNDENNSIVVKVDNKRKRDAVPTLNTDWWNYGGITRDVDVVEVPATFIADYTIQLKKGSFGEIAGTVKLDGVQKNQSVKIEIPEIKQTTTINTDENGVASFSISVKNLSLWSPENPKLYEVTVASATDKVTERVGFRTIETKGTDILLNGKSVFLRGICIHEENAMRGGRAYSKEDALMLLGWAKELNCNYVRLAHYPHNENMARVADELGILVWEEIPVYWTILWDNPDTYTNAQKQLTDEITRDKNRASVIIWSMANETPVSEPRTNFLRKLAEHARGLDNTRLISAALEVHGNSNPNDKVVEDPFAEFVDIVNFNEYVGWYDGLPEKCDRINWVIKYNKPVMISEFGADALQGLHGDILTRWTEEYQEDLYKRTLPMLSKIPQFRGLTPWILCDFRSPKRMLPNIQDGWNRKGLIGQNGTKKKAFFVLRDFYNQKELEYKQVLKK
jgi:beta-glucuronidase